MLVLYVLREWRWRSPCRRLSIMGVRDRYSDGEMGVAGAPDETRLRDLSEAPSMARVLMELRTPGGVSCSWIRRGMRGCQSLHGGHTKCASVRPTCRRRTASRLQSCRVGTINDNHQWR